MNMEQLVGGFSGSLTLIITIGFWVLGIAGRWKVFEKAGKEGWKSLIPFYSSYCLYDIALGRGWMFLLGFIPLVNIGIGAYYSYSMALAFGRGLGTGILLFFFEDIMMIVLGFGDYEYQGPER